MALKLNSDNTFSVEGKFKTKFPRSLNTHLAALSQGVKEGKFTTKEILDYYERDLKEAAEDTPYHLASGTWVVDILLSDFLNVTDDPPIPPKDILERELKGGTGPEAKEKIIVKLSFKKKIYGTYRHDSFDNNGMQFINCTPALLKCLQSKTFRFLQGDFAGMPNQTPEIKVEQVDAKTFGAIDLEMISTHNIISNMAFTKDGKDIFWKHSGVKLEVHLAEMLGQA